jgi:hypothetical protein
MSSEQDAGAEPMDSQHEETKVVAQKADLPPTSTVADKPFDPLPPMSRDAFTKLMQDFYDHSIAGVGGLMRQNLDYVVKSATATRHRVTNRNGLYFSDSPDRQRVIRKFYTRFLHDFNYKGRALPPEGSGSSPHFSSVLEIPPGRRHDRNAPNRNLDGRLCDASSFRRN